MKNAAGSVGIEISVNFVFSTFGLTRTPIFNILYCVYTTFTAPPTVHEGACFSASSPTLVTFWFFDSGHPNEVISHYGSDLYFPDD